MAESFAVERSGRLPTFLCPSWHLAVVTSVRSACQIGHGALPTSSNDVPRVWLAGGWADLRALQRVRRGRFADGSCRCERGISTVASSMRRRGVRPTPSARDPDLRTHGHLRARCPAWGRAGNGDALRGPPRLTVLEGGAGHLRQLARAYPRATGPSGDAVPLCRARLRCLRLGIPRSLDTDHVPVYGAGTDRHGTTQRQRPDGYHAPPELEPALALLCRRRPDCETS